MSRTIGSKDLTDNKKKQIKKIIRSNHATRNDIQSVLLKNDIKISNTTLNNIINETREEDTIQININLQQISSTQSTPDYIIFSSVMRNDSF